MRIILHVDVNNAFLSWTAVDMLRNGSKIDIRNRYAVIGGDESARRGIVIAKSNLCKARGVKTADTLYSARRKCPYLDVYSGNREVYREFSDKMYNYLLSYTNIIERYSIDECFIDYTYSYKLFGDPVELAYKIKNDIKKLFGFTVNVGIGNNKLEAKMASDFSKPDKVHTLFDNEVKTKMWPLPIDDLFMLGKSSASKLHDMGINTIGELANSDRELLIKRFKSHGKMMWEYANGIDDSIVNYMEHDVKSISNSTVLPYDYTNHKECLEVIRELSTEVGKRLRNKKMYASNVNIWIKYNNFKKVSKQITLDNSIHTDDDIYYYSTILFDKLWDTEFSIRGLCVGVGSLSNNDNRQLSLFDNSINNKNIKNNDERLQKVIDEIREKYGVDSIKYANKKQ